ncbi:MAG: MarR family transcriptional regulator [Bacteroidota bacterium]
MDPQFFQTIDDIISTGHQMTEGVGQKMRAVGMTEPQYKVLKILREADSGPLSMQDILKGMVSPSSNVTRIVDKLLDKGYVIRRECPTNRRKIDIELTEAGAKILLELEVKVKDYYQPFMRRLSVAELEELRRLIGRLQNPDQHE